MKVSVVIPVYNAEPYLERCLTSVLGQTLDEIEVICVDDGSCDKSLQILQRYKTNDPRVKILQQEHLYAGAARNKGMEAAIGKYVIFLDADDEFHKELLQQLYEKSEETGADITICDFTCIDKRTTKARTGFLQYVDHLDYFHVSDFDDCIFQVTWAVPWNKLYRRDFILKTGLRFQNTRVLNDAYFVNLTLVMAKKIAVVQRKLITYWQYNEASSVASREQHVDDTFKMLNAMKAELIERNRYEAVEKSFFNFAVATAIWDLLNIRTWSVYKEKEDSIREFLKELHAEVRPKADFEKETVYQTVHRFMNQERSQFLLEQLVGVREALLQSVTYNRKLERQVNAINTLKNAINILKKENQRKRWRFPNGRILRGSKLVLYGAGNVGKDFYLQITEDKIYSLVAWVDQNAEKYKEEGYPVKHPDSIENLEYDVVLIGVANEDVAEEIEEMLINMGVGKDKIYVWQHG